MKQSLVSFAQQRNSSFSHFSRIHAQAGVKAVADYIHGLGMKIGIYTAPHAVTCGKYTGSLGHEKVDAQTFADWVSNHPLTICTCARLVHLFYFLVLRNFGLSLNWAYVGVCTVSLCDAIRTQGIDFVKLDAGCQDDCSFHDGCIKVRSLERACAPHMRK